MINLLRYLTLFCCLFVGMRLVASEKLKDGEREAVLKLANEFKTAMLAHDHVSIVKLLHPSTVKSVGGREKMIQFLQAEDAKNKAAGIEIESVDFTSTADAYTGSTSRITFVNSVMVLKSPGLKIRSKSFFIAFVAKGSKKWYMLDGTQMTATQFQEMFPGMPDDLKLPNVEKTRL